MPDYKFKRDIARGGFGRVCVVEDENGFEFAKKTLDPAPSLAAVPIDSLKKRFAREVKYQQAIQHPNVVRIVDVDMASEPPFCIMELAEGTLHDDIKADRTLGGNPSPALFDILAGLECLAEKGFIHRDLKPQNVLKLRNDDDSIRYAISDFGLMRPDTADTTTLTVTGAQGGTPFYAAPELMQDFGRATVQADIYSFGAILHDIFADQQRIPYTELTVSGPLASVIEKCTKQNPARRYSNISQLREDLFSVLDVEDISFNSSREQRAVELLGADRVLNGSEWDEIFYALDENDSKSIENGNIFRSLRGESIKQLAEDSPELVKSLGGRFCEYVMSKSFDFDYCDILSARLRVFFDKGDLELRALVLLALLELGTSHNRWLVERAFHRRVLEDAEQTLIQRLLTEISVRDYDIQASLRHLIKSIGVKKESFHPLLQKAI